MKTTHLVYLLIFGKDIDPLQAQSEHLSREFIDHLHIILCGVIHQRDERVKVEIYFTSNELGAFCGVIEAKEIALDNPSHPIEHCHIICIVQVEFSQGYLCLSGVIYGVFSERCNS